MLINGRKFNISLINETPMAMQLCTFHRQQINDSVRPSVRPSDALTRLPRVRRGKRRVSFVSRPKAKLRAPQL